MSLLGKAFNLFLAFVWQCINLIEGNARLILCFDRLIISLCKVALKDSLTHLFIYFETLLSRFSMIEIRFQETFESRRR